MTVLSAARRSGKARLGLREALLSNAVAYLFLAPALLFFVVFQAGPLITTIVLSFYEGGILSGFSYSGFDNYLTLWSDREFYQTIRFTLLYFIIIVPSVLVVSLVMAALLNDKFIRGKNFFKSAIFFPSLAPMVTLSTLWLFMIFPNVGLINMLLAVVNVREVEWLSSPLMATLTIVLVELWRGVGFYMVIFLAGLVAIPEELYEAAELDGAGPFRQFWSITLPQLRPTITFCLIMAVIFNFQLFDAVYMITGGGPGGSTESIAWYIFSNAFKYDQLGLASAISTVLLLAVMSVTAVLLKVLPAERSS